MTDRKQDIVERGMLEQVALAMIDAMPAFVGEKNRPEQPDTFCSYVDCQDVDFSDIAREALLAMRPETDDFVDAWAVQLYIDGILKESK